MAGNLILRSVLAGSVDPPPQGTSDWAARSTAQGVIWATKFDTQAEVDNWRYTNQNNGMWDPNSTQSQSGLLTWRQGEGINGGNALRIEDSTVSNNPVAWWRTLDNTKTAGIRSATYIVPPGTAIYVQARCKINALRMNNDTGQGLKMIEVTSAVSTNVNQEAFVARYYNRRFPQIQGSTNTQFEPNRWDYTNLPASDYNLQVGSQYGSCLYSTQPTGCYLVNADEWVTYHMKVIGGTGGVHNTVVKLEVARDTDSQYTTIYERTDLLLPIPADGTAVNGYDNAGGTGYSAVALFNRNESHAGLPAGCYHYYTEVIASLSPIACPTPALSPASWFSGLTANQWVDANATGRVTNKIRNVAYTVGDGRGDPDGITATWSGGTVDYDRGRLLVWGGGHTDYGGNEIYALPLTGTTNAWSRVVDNMGTGTIPDTPDTQAGYGNGTFLGTVPSASHSYNRLCYGNNRLWIPGIDSQYTSSGYWSTATYAYDFINSRWEYYGQGIPNSNNFAKWLGGHAIYDRTHNKVYSMCQTTSGTNKCFFAKDATSQTQNSFISQSFTATVDNYKWGVNCHDLDLWVFGSVNNFPPGRVNRVDLSNPTQFISCTPGGPAQNATINNGTGAFYHRNARKIYLYNHDFGGGNILVIDIPTVLSNSWNFRMVTIGGTDPVTNFAGDNDTDGVHSGPYGRFNGLEFSDGQALLVLVTHIDSSAYFMRVPAAGL
jgi:hypothetical protein